MGGIIQAPDRQQIRNHCRCNSPAPEVPPAKTALAACAQRSMHPKFNKQLPALHPLLTDDNAVVRVFKEPASLGDLSDPILFIMSVISNGKK